jgi:hypothetical protein
MGHPVLVTKFKSKYTMKNLLLILGIISLGFFSACGGGHDHDCCGECSENKAECCGKCGGDKADDAKKGEASE